MNKVENDVDAYLEKINMILDNKKRIIAEAKERNAQVITATAASTVPSGQHCQQGDQYRALSELKPKFLEKEANLLEVKNWIQHAKNYIEARYKDCPPEKGVYRYILPLLHHTWAKSFDKTDSYNRTLQELTDSLEDETNDPKHSRRLKPLQIRRGSDAHSDFMDKLREAASVIELNKMSLDEFIIHLFIRDADSTMAKMAQEILEKEKPDINFFLLLY